MNRLALRRALKREGFRGHAVTRVWLDQGEVIDMARAVLRIDPAPMPNDANFQGSGKLAPVETLTDRPEDIKHSQTTSVPQVAAPRRAVKLDLRAPPSAMETRWAGR